MRSSRGRAVLVAALPLAALACAPAPRALDWEIVLPADDDRADAITTWEAWIAPGGCPAEHDGRDARDAGADESDAGLDGGVDGADGGALEDAGSLADAGEGDAGAAPLYRTSWLATASGATEAPPILPPGTYGLVVVGRDAECRAVLAGCRSVDLPRLAGERVHVELARADGPACEACAGGLCRDARPAGFRTCIASAEGGASCDDGRDDDCDRRADCLDDDCAGGPACEACSGDADCGICARCDPLAAACVPADDGATCALSDGSEGTCTSGTCCVGCVADGVCASGTSTSYCGAAGSACAACACPGDDRCDAGACVAVGSAAQVAAGEDHGCVIDDDGALFCWGDNTSGRLGVGDVADRDAPTAARCSVSTGCTWTSVATSSGHACGILEDGTGVVRLACWGANDAGQLGAGAASTTRPINVGAGLGNGTHLPIAVDVGDGFTCAVVHLDLAPPGVVYCWGSADEGRLGLGAGATNRSSPTRVTISADPPADFVAIALGRAHACALTSDQRLFCWGANDRGQTGLGAGAGATVDAPRAHPRAEWHGVAAGGDHACGAVLPTGSSTQRVRCWGANDAGQLGLGHLTDRETPSQLVLAGRRGWSLSVGARHTCVIEDDAAGGDDLFCFGENADLRVAAGAPDATMPVRVAGAWRAAAAGGDHTCAIGAGGDLWCWGANDEAQLGRPSGAPEAPARTCL